MNEHALPSNRMDKIGELAMKFNRASDTEKEQILVDTVQHLPENERDLFITVGILTSLLSA